MNELQEKNKNTEAVTVNDSQLAVDQSAASERVAIPEPAPSGARVTLRTLRAETEMNAISRALQQTGWNRKRAAQLLSISYRGLLYKIRQHNITRDQDASVSTRSGTAEPPNNWESPGLAVAGGMDRTPAKD